MNRARPARSNVAMTLHAPSPPAEPVPESLRSPARWRPSPRRRPRPAQVNLPALGDSISEQVDVAAERRLGDQVMREIRRDPDYLDDPLLLEYVQSIWQPLVAAARARGDIGSDTDGRFAWQAFLVRDRASTRSRCPAAMSACTWG